MNGDSSAERDRAQFSAGCGLDDCKARYKKFHAFKHLAGVPENMLHVWSAFCLYSLIHKRISLDSLMGRDYRGFQCEIVGFSGVC